VTANFGADSPESHIVATNLATSLSRTGFRSEAGIPECTPSLQWPQLFYPDAASDLETGRGSTPLRATTALHQLPCTPHGSRPGAPNRQSCMRTLATLAISGNRKSWPLRRGLCATARMLCDQPCAKAVQEDGLCCLASLFCRASAARGGGGACIRARGGPSDDARRVEPLGQLNVAAHRGGPKLRGAPRLTALGRKKSPTQAIVFIILSS
jgi:hypothetical protein